MYNLLPVEQQKILRHEYRLRIITIALFLLASIFLCGFLSLVPSITLTYIKHSSYQEEIALIKEKAKDGTDKTFTSTIQIVNDQVKILSLVDQEHIPHKVFDSIIGNRGEGIKLTKFSYEVLGTSTPVTIEGTSAKLENLLKFQEIMQKTKPFSKAEFPIDLLSKPKNSEVRFVMQLK